MNTPRLFRKRLIPAEIMPLDRDCIVRADREVIVTHWQAIKPRPDFSHGRSCYFLNEGFKVSKLFTRDNRFYRYYCDIVRLCYDKDKNHYVFTDLLFDVIIEPCGFVRVLDLDEGSTAFMDGIISKDELCYALETLHRLLEIIYAGDLKRLTQYIDDSNDK